MNVWMTILLFFTATRAWAAYASPIFEFQGTSFTVHQQGVFNAGNYERELSDSEMIAIVRDRRYEFSLDYVMEYQKYSYWVMPINNRNDHPTRIFLRFPLLMQTTKVWLYKGESLQPFARYPVVADMFHIELPPGESLLMGMRLSGGDVRGRAKTITVRDFASAAWLISFEQHVMGSVGGAVAIMILYNLGMYLFFRKIYFLYYSIYSAAALYCVGVFNGYAPWVLPQLAVGLGIAGVGLVLFTNSSLSLRSTQPRLYQVSLGFLLYIVFFCVLMFVQPKWNYVAFSMPTALLYCIYASIRRALDGYRPALYLIVGWGLLAATAIISVVNVAFIGSTLLGNLSPYGLALEVCFFSFAIGQKVRLSEQRALRESEHAFNQLKKVFYPHQIQQIKAGLELEKTMPTGRAQAAVISFDIIESSRIQQPQAKAFIENSIKACVSIISENYQPDQLVANGYRIKEVGDGFLCSVGYPFQLPQGGQPAACAVELSLRFIRIFQQQVDQLLDHQPVYCSIGIAFDGLEGYFPKVGTIEYDVYGRAVILATRYEAFRRQLFPNGVPGHILTLHERIHQQLPADLQGTFEEVDLQRAHLVVRDDLGATKLYFRVIRPTEGLDREREAG